MQLVNKLQKDATAEPGLRTVQLQGVKTQSVNVQGKTEVSEFAFHKHIRLEWISFFFLVVLA